MARVLYIEDNDDNIFMLRSRLTKRGFDVLVARDGQAGVEAAAADPPDIIIIDLGLPILDGWEATRQIKANPNSAHVPVIALSAHAMREDVDRALAAGCDDYEAKPVSFARLLEKMNSLLEGAS